jgi:hypothetical protein
MEVRWSPRRSHDDAVHDRRATRLFIKRSAASADAAALLDALRDSGGAVPAGIEAAALVTEMLLVAADGSVVPSTITFEVQLRIFNRWGRATTGRRNSVSTS